MKIKCQAEKTGFWQDRRIVSAGDPMRDRLSPPMGTADTFTLDERGFKYEDDGEKRVVLVDSDMRPILPKWVKPLEEVPRIPSHVPHRIVEPLELRKLARKNSASIALADPKPVEPAADEFVAPQKRGPGRPRKNDAAVL